MSRYRTLPTNQRPLPLNVDSETYVNEWKACWEDKSRDMTYLVTLAEPVIKHWQNMLTRSIKPDINMVSLCARLGDSPKRAIKRIDKWIAWCKTHASLEDQLWYLFIEHVRTANYFPTFAHPLMAEYVLARDFKSCISEDIKKAKVRHYIEEPFDPRFTHVAINPIYPDHLLLKNLGLNSWESYLLWWVSNGLTYKDAATTTHIPFDTLKRELRYTWHLLKENYSREEQ